MFLRKRLLKAKSADQFAALLLDELRRIDEFRDPLFVHEKKISEYFAQTIAPITEIVTSKEFEGNLSGGVLTFAQAGGSRRSGSSATLALTPMNQLVLLEHAERERGRLIDLASGPPAEGMLLSFVGDGRIFVPGDQVREDPGIGLGAESAAVLERERKKREAQRGQVEGWEKFDRLGCFRFPIRLHNGLSRRRCPWLLDAFGATAVRHSGPVRRVNPGIRAYLGSGYLATATGCESEKLKVGCRGFSAAKWLHRRAVQ